MRSLIIGGIVFVIWSVFSVWLYVNKLMPLMHEQVTEQSISEQPQTLPDTLLVDSVQQSQIEIPENMLVLFEFDDYSFNPNQQMKDHAIKFKTWFDNNPKCVFSITGHTDNIGTDQYNQVLGHKRAQTMQKYLVELGVDQGNLLVVSKGESEPIADNSTDDGRAKNRRTVIALEK